MTVIAELPGISVTIRADGKPLTAYDDDEMEYSLGDDLEHYAGHEVSRYIECVAGQEFAIVCSAGRPHPYTKECPGLKIGIVIDGARQPNYHMDLETTRFLPKNTTTINGVWSMVPEHNRDDFRMFKFLEITICRQNPTVDIFILIVVSGIGESSRHCKEGH